MTRQPIGLTIPYRKMTKTENKPAPIPAPATPKEWVEWVEYAQSRIKALEARIESLESKNAQYKQTIRQMDRRIMQG